MGSENSTSITQSELESSFIGSVTDGSKPNSNPFNLYYRKSQDLLLIDVGETSKPISESHKIVKLILLIEFKSI